ncbi:MAG TPA: NADH-quinone oxidoreductase subunit C, partial [Thermoplasmatales archaeon]|nr:NADH-quinone oxidoreductase subunit C [Thermoplasmatales archaeon]
MSENIEDLLQSFKDKFGENVKDTRFEKHPTGAKKDEELLDFWITLDRSVFKEAVRYLTTLEEYPHLSVISGYDAGNTINLVYHFSIGFGEKNREVTINLVVPLPKEDPVIDTITDIIPGALISEQEKQEMLGVKIKDIPKNDRVFISEDFPEDKYPWRKDDKGVDDLARNLH